jgi:N-acetylglucosaminyldiphosphoundecaprenol N-acetyl-beta-D-mannosaminyltransferase
MDTSRRIVIGPISFNHLTSKEIVKKIIDQLRSGIECHQIMGGNSNHVYIAYKNSNYAQICKSSTIFFPDGQSILIASWFAGTMLPERIAGPDLMLTILSECSLNGFKVFLLGGSETSLANLVSNMQSLFPGIVAGSYSPPFGIWSENENNTILSKINDSGAALLLVGISAPKQDLWIYEHKDRLKTKVAIGLGAAFDFHSGRIKRAPIWMQNICLEWFHRFLQEPRRMWKRYLFANAYLTSLIIKMILAKLFPIKMRFKSADIL